PLAIDGRASRSDGVLETGCRAMGPDLGPHDRRVAGQPRHRHSVEAVPRSVDRGLVARARAGHEHRRVRPVARTLSRSVAGDDGARQEGRRPADRGGAADAQHGLADAAHGGGPEGAWMIGKTIAELRPGDYAEIERHVEMDAIAEFIDAVGDFNPIHSDPAYAAATSFGEPIAPGVFTAGLISAVIGTQLPG